jgi:hypothetical protein
VKLTKLIKKITHATGYKDKILVAKDTVDIFKIYAKIDNCSAFCLMREVLGFVTKEEFNRTPKMDTNLIDQYGLSRLRLKGIDRRHNYSGTVGGVHSRSRKLIIINKRIEKCSKEHIKYVILHEIGHHFRGTSEAEADKFAEEWINKV